MRSGDFLEDPVSQLAAPLIAKELETLGAIPEGAHVGPYRVIREIGRGGMGVVCLAERDDGEYQKRVALKVVLRRPGMEEVSVQRFRAERQILAELEHPGIARMLDGGMWEGTPWFAMEYADGLPIDEYCRANALSLDARLELFAAVCDVVQYAHDRKIVHRDIKPSNILVANGAVKLLDFGIASLTTGDPGSDGQPTLRSLTPGFASPEQMRGEPATTASDVYSLGVLLERMLNGVEVSDAIDTITGTALRADPEKRYASAGALAIAVRADVAQRAATAVRARKSNSIRISRGGQVVYGVAIAAITSLIAAGVTIAVSDSRPAYGPSAIAVLPFEPSVADSAFLRLGRDLAITLSADLDGLGDIRTIDPLTILSRRPAAAKHSSLGEDVALARSLGVGRVLRGSITQAGGAVRIDAAIYALDGAVPLARASTTVAADNVAEATDSLRVGLLRQLWKGRELPATSLAALSTRSPSALRAYLDGERLVVQYRMPEAAQAFARAIEADSTFWFAYWRHAWAREFSSRRADTTITAVYRQHRHEFAERDRLLIEARMAPKLVDRIALTRKAALRFQDYWPAWLDYAEILVHQGPYAGHSLAESREVLERTVRVNPGLTAAWDHLMWIALSDLDTIASRRVLSTLERLRYDSAAIANGGGQVLVLYRFLDGIARTGIADSALTDSVAQQLVAGSRPEEGRFQGGISRYGFHDARIAIGRRVVATPGIGKPALAFELAEEATTWASRGAWDSALVTADRSTAVMPEPARVLYAYRLATVGAFLGMVDTTVMNARRADASGAFERLPAPARAELAWVDGVRAATLQDRAALARARAALRGAADPFLPQLDSSLMAFDFELAGKRREATTVLRALEYDRYLPTDRRHPYLAGIDRLVLSRWLRDAGKTEEAAHVLKWYEAVTAVDGQTGHANAMLAGLAYFERARLEDVEGQPEVARLYDEQFLRRFDMPDPRAQHLVTEARAAIARRARR